MSIIWLGAPLLRTNHIWGCSNGRNGTAGAAGQGQSPTPFSAAKIEPEAEAETAAKPETATE